MSVSSLPSVLIADDDKEICKLIEILIKPISSTTTITNTGKQTLQCIETSMPDVIILDLSFPDLDGFSICSWIRKNETIPQPIIIILTARNSDKDKINSFDIGADEYISKPFSPAFLSKRIHMLWQQKNSSNSTTTNTTKIQFNEIILDIEQKRAFIEENEIYLTFMEWQILLLFMQHPGKVLSRSFIIQHVKGDNFIIYDRVIDVHIVALRKKLGHLKSYICTKRSMGYYLDNTK